MKSLKAFVVLALSAFLIFGCVTTSKHSRKLNEPVKFKVGNHPSIGFYNQRSPWDSPFNPHEVLRYWKKIFAESIDSTSILVIVGNPKIDWTGNKRSPDSLLIPEGEFATAVAFMFVITKNSAKPELVGYGYTDRNGRKQLYRWEGSKRKYTQFRDSTERSVEIY